MEEVYENQLRKYATFIWDSLTNLEFAGHPHSNKTDNEWRDLFSEQDLKVKSADYMTDFGFLKVVVYYLQG